MPAPRNGTSASSKGGVTIVTQTRPIAGQEDAFRSWQDEIGTEVSKWPGFIEQQLIPPSPPGQFDWVTLLRFSSVDAATGWLRSTERLRLVERIQSILAGSDDVHIIQDGASGVLPAAASVVISTRLLPGQENAYRRWEQRIAAAQAKAPGFQGYRLEPPIPGVQDDWLAIIRFDSEHNLENWLKSPERQKLVKESEPFTDSFNTRIVRSGFDQWFPVSKNGAPSTPVWKQNMIVLLLLYPVVFLFGAFVQQPVLVNRLKMPFWLALFVGNVVSILLLNSLVPFTSNRFAWWLNAAGSEAPKTTLIGAGVVIVLYAAWLFAFSQM
jgi:antibiotic biosynthesis monooxygenase (ABM) superfamily enzyme